MADGGSLRQPDDEVPGDDPERERLIAAFGRVASEVGYSKLTVEQVLRYARVSRESFDEHFASKEQGLIAAQDAFLERLWAEVAAACETQADWPSRVRAALETVLSSMVETSSLARVFAVEAAATSVAAAERQLAALDRFAELLSEGRRRYPEAASLPEVTERAVIGGVASIVGSHLLMEEPQEIPPREAQLVELLLMPYVGVEEARRVAAG